MLESRSKPNMKFCVSYIAAFSVAHPGTRSAYPRKSLSHGNKRVLLGLPKVRHAFQIRRGYSVYSAEGGGILSRTISSADRSSLSPKISSITPEPAGGKGPLSAEFLALSGTLATLGGLIFILPLVTGYFSKLVFGGNLLKAFCVALSSFAYGTLLSRFDLSKAGSVKLTIVFSLLTRFICSPILSHSVAIAGYALFKLSSAKTAAAAAAAAAAAVSDPVTVKATAESLSLPAGVLSSLFLLSTTPVSFSPSAAMLSMHIHTTLFAILSALTLILFPLVPCISHAVSVWAHRSAFLNIGGILPQVAPPPNLLLLLLTTTLPFLAGVLINKMISKRLGAGSGLIALPLAWVFSLLLMASAVQDVVQGGITGLVGSIGLSGGVALMMWLLGRGLGFVLLLDERAKRTLVLYLCTQGAVVGIGVAPPGFSSAPHVASALVGLILTFCMAQIWSHVVIRRSRDVIL